MSSEAYPNGVELAKKLRVATILVFHDPRDWALDIQIVTDLLFSYRGYLGTLSEKNGRRGYENNGYLQDGQPSLWISNPDLRWASEYPLNRLGQGAFRSALVGVWDSLTGGAKNGAKLQYQQMGKPSGMTYGFAEHRLLAHRKALLEIEGDSGVGLGDVYMVGGQPRSSTIYVLHSTNSVQTTQQATSEVPTATTPVPEGALTPIQAGTQSWLKQESIRAAQSSIHRRS